MTTPATPGTQSTPAPAPAEQPTEVTPAAPAAPGTETPPQGTTPAPAEQQQATPPAPAPEVIGETPAPANEAPSGVTYQPTGDAGLDIALDFVGKLGLGPDHAAITAAQEGDFTKLEATLEAMGDKATGFERYVELAKQAYGRNKEATEASQTAITNVCNEVAGDAQTWAAVKQWAGQNATPEEKAAINDMLTAGPVQARIAAQSLVNLYRDAAGTVVNPAPATIPTAGPASSTNNGALSPADYNQAVRELRGQMGSRMDGSPEYQALRARRMAWQG